MNLHIDDEQKMNEIVFANRNKSYGAYAIRASYNNSVFRALAIIVSSVLLFAGMTYVFNTQKEEIKHLTQTNLIDSFRVVEFRQEEKITPPENKPKSTPPAGSENAQSTTVVDSVPDLGPDLLNNQLANNNHSDTSGTGPEVPGGAGSGGSSGLSTFSMSPVNNEPVTFVDENPEFEGGVDALRRFIRDNTVYPSVARDVGIEGTVYISFVVDEKGKVGAVKVLRGISGGCTEEAARVVAKLPDFKKPGKVGGQPVKSWYNIPIAFKLR
jgi:protein TonB